MGLSLRNNGRATTMPAGLALGGTVSLLTTVLLSAVLAWMITSEKLRQNQIGYGVMLILLTAAFLGAKVASGKIQRRHLLVCEGTGLIYLVMLLSMTALFFGGQYSGVGESALMIVCGCTLAFLLRKGHRRPGNVGNRKRHYR